MTDYKNELEKILERFAKLYANTERKLSPPFATATQKLNYFNNHDYELYEATEAIEALLSQHSTEHIITNTPGSTFATCSCGKGFGTTSEQQQHIAWNLELAKAQHSKKRELEAETRLLEYLATSGPKYTHAAVMDELAYCKDRINQLGGQDETNKGE